MNQSHKRVLVHLPAPPSPADTGSKRRVLGILKYFRERQKYFLVDAVSNNDFGKTAWNQAEKTETLKFVNNLFIYENGQNLLDFLYSRSQSFYYQKLLRQQLPIDSDYFTPPGFVSFVRELVSQQAYDVILINYIEFAHLVTKLNYLESRIAIDIHDLSSQMRLVKQKNFSLSQGLKFDYESSLISEAELLNKFDAVLVNSEKEKTILSSHISTKKLHLVPHPIEDNSQSVPKRYAYSHRPFKYDLLFVGSAYRPNVEGINFFLTSILPSIIAQKPDIRLAIAGTVTESIEIEKALANNIVCLGYVSDLAELYLSSKLFICPLIDGAGTKVKLLEAMSYALPIVTTSVGASGLNLTHATNAFIIDDPTIYACQILRLLDDPKLAEQTSSEVAETFATHYSNLAIYSKLDHIFGISP